MCGVKELEVPVGVEVVAALVAVIRQRLVRHHHPRGFGVGEDARGHPFTHIHVG
jgi:hypothetical protein